MKIKINEILKAKQSFEKVMASELDFKLAYRCRKILKKVIKELENYNETRNELIKKHGEPVKNKKGKVIEGSFVVSKKNTKKFREEEKGLLEMEVELGADLIPYEALEGCKISPIDVVNIELFIAEPVASQESDEQEEND